MYSTYRSIIRGQVRPYGCIQNYPTGWAGEQTCPQLYDDLADYASNVMKRNGLQQNERPECLQTSFAALLETLRQYGFLAGKTRQQAVFFVLAPCRSSSLCAYNRPYECLEALGS